MLCVETANAADDAVTLAAGGRHLMSATLSVEARRLSARRAARRARAARRRGPRRRCPRPAGAAGRRPSWRPRARPRPRPRGGTARASRPCCRCRRPRWSARPPRPSAGARLVAQGLIAAADLDAAERALSQARETRRAHAATSLAEAETLVTEAEAARELAALPPPAPGRDAGAALADPLRGRRALVAGGAARPRALLHHALRPRAAGQRARPDGGARPARLRSPQRARRGRAPRHRRGPRAHGLPARPRHPVPGLPQPPGRRGHRRPRARRRAERPPSCGESPGAWRARSGAREADERGDRLGGARRRDGRAAAPLPDDRHHESARQRDRRGRGSWPRCWRRDGIAERDRGVGARAAPTSSPGWPATARWAASSCTTTSTSSTPTAATGRSTRSAASSPTATSTGAARST